MPIITISRDSYSFGKQVAGYVADILGYQCIGPETIGNNLKLDDFFRDKKGFFNDYYRDTGIKKQQSFALFRSAFFEYVKQDNIVYCGTSGHIFLSNVPNVIKVRLLADFNDRVKEKMRRESLSYHEASKTLTLADEAFLHQRDYSEEEIQKTDYSLYEILLNLSKIELDTAVAVIVNMVRELSEKSPRQEAMQSRLEDLALVARVEARLFEFFDQVEAVVRNGEVFISIKESRSRGENAEKMIEKAMKIVSQIKGLHKAKIGVIQPADPIL